MLMKAKWKYKTIEELGIQRSRIYYIYSWSFLAFLRLISLKYRFSNPLPLTTPSHRYPGAMLYLLGGPSYLHFSNFIGFFYSHRRIGSSHTLLSLANLISSLRCLSSSDYSLPFFIPFYHYANLAKTSCFLFYFYYF